MIDRTRPLSLGELLDETFRLYRSNVGLFVATAALVLVPLSLLQARRFRLFLDGPLSLPTLISDQFFTDMLLGLSGRTASRVDWLYGFLLGPLLSAALIWAADRRYHNHPASIHTSLLAGASRLPALVGLDLLRALVIVLAVLPAGVGTILYMRSRFAIPLELLGSDPSLPGASSPAGFGALFLVALGLLLPAMFISARLSLAGQVLMIEQLGLLQSLKRSWQLSSGAGWRLLLYIIAITLLTQVIVALAASSMGLLLIRLLDMPYVDVATRILSQCVTLPFTVIALTLMYDDLRRRTEGFDLEQQAAEWLPSTAGQDS